MSTERMHVESSALSTAEYNDTTNTMVIGFKDGTQYRYNGVDKHEWAQFKAASSKGQWFNAVLRYKSNTKIGYK